MKDKFRIRLRFNGFEPQMQYTAGETGKPFWTPLLATGYWAEPESFSFGAIKGKHPLSLREARKAIERAKRINSCGLLAASDSAEGGTA